MAEHFISEFFSVFAELGIRPEFYRMRDIYRSGKFNDAIDQILRKADVVRRIYKEVSGSERADNWHPFQVICPNCGRIATTEVTAYDGTEVTYRCHKQSRVMYHPVLPTGELSETKAPIPGCGHEGKMSPLNGNGKLPWKLECVREVEDVSGDNRGRGARPQHQGRLARCGPRHACGKSSAWSRP